MAVSGPQEVKLFGKWSYDDVEVRGRTARETAATSHSERQSSQ